MAVCTNCGAQVPNTVKFCTECGRPMAAAPTPVTYGGTPAPETYVGETPARSGGKGKTILLISLAALLLIGAVIGVLFLTGVLGGNKDYDRAMELYKTGQYESAAALFDSLGDYKDSAEMANSSRYEQAKNAYNQEDYTTALRLFQGLGSYKDSADWAGKCQQQMDYDRAMALYKQGDYASAGEIFQGLGSYKDSADWAEKCQDKLFNPVGTYHLTGIVIDGEDYSDYISVLGYDSYTITFNSDGTGAMAGDGSNVRFTWSGNIMDDGTDQIPFTCSGDTISFETEGVKMTFTRGEAPAGSGSPSTGSPSTGSSTPNGTYKLTGIVIDGEDYSDYISTIGYDNYTITFNSDGTGSLVGDGSNVRFTWDDSVIDDGTDRIPYTCTGNSVSFETQGVEMTFTREVKGPEGKYTGYYANGDVLSVITFNSDGTFTEDLDNNHWYGTWVLEGNNVTCTYGDDGSHDYYVWNPSNDTLDWKGEGRVTYRKG